MGREWRSGSTTVEFVLFVHQEFFVMTQHTSLACLNVVAEKQEVKVYLPYAEGTPF